MQRRVWLLFVLFLVVAAFYASVTREGLPAIVEQQRAQTELFNRLDETVSDPETVAVNSSGN